MAGTDMEKLSVLPAEPLQLSMEHALSRLSCGKAPLSTVAPVKLQESAQCHISSCPRCALRRHHPMSLRKETWRAHGMRNASAKLLVLDDAHFFAKCPTSLAT
eukprot:UN2748